MKTQRYSSESDLARQVCEAIGWTFAISPIKVYATGKKIYATGTLLHPDEWCKLIAWDGLLIDGRRLTITRRPKGY